MRINLYNPTFKGIYNKSDKALFASDLDGTYLQGEDIKKDDSEETKQAKIAKLNNNIKEVDKTVGQVNAIKAYATGRTKASYYKEKEALLKKGIIINDPDYLISNDGQYIDEKLFGTLIRDTEYIDEIKDRTNFDRNEVIDAIHKLGHIKEYRLNPEKFENLDDLDRRKELDPKFWDSKIAYYEWNASDFKTEFIVADDVDMQKLQNDITAELIKKGIKAKFIVEQFPKFIIDVCPKSIKLQCQPTRHDKDGGVRVLYVCAANKADAVEYIRKKENIKHKEVITAGDGLNDESLLEYSYENDAHFISVANSHPHLLNKVKEMQSLKPKSVIHTINAGTKGVLSGLDKIITNAKNRV